MNFFEWVCDCGGKGCPECDPKKRDDNSTDKDKS